MKGRGTECIHPAVVCQIYKKEQPAEIESVDDATILQQLSEISKGNFDCLFDLNISNFGEPLPTPKRLFLVSSLIHTKFSAIDQFSSGMSSVSPDLVKSSSFDTMKQYLTYQNKSISFNEISFLFKYPQKEKCTKGLKEYW